MTYNTRTPNGPHPVTFEMIKMAPRGATSWAEHHDPDLKRLIDAGKPLILMGRNSSVGGRQGARAAAADLHQAAVVLRKDSGWDVRILLPPEEELTEILFCSRNVVESTERDGSPFRNQFRMLDLSSGGLFVSLSAGSGMKNDASWAQPHAVWTLKALQELRPQVAGFFVRRFDRFVRTAWGPGAVLQELRYMKADLGGSWAGDEDGRLDVEESQDLVIMVKGISAQRDGRNIASRRLQRIPELTGTELVDGVVRSSVSSHPPPGLMIYRDRSRHRLLAVDEPDNYPDERSEALSGLPNVRLADGELADQAGTVAYFLENVYRDGKTPSSFAEELTERRFSTHTLRERRKHGDSAYYGSSEYVAAGYACDADVWTRSILKNLTFYETGVLPLKYGKEEDQVIEVKNFFPRRGFWASKADFARIKRARKDSRAFSAAARRGWSMSGLAATLDGMPVTLRPVYTSQAEDPVSWTLSMDKDQMDERRMSGSPESGQRVPSIPDDVLVGAMLRGLWQADGTPIRSRLRISDPSVVNESVRGQLRSIAEEREMIVAVQAHELVTMTALGADKQPLLDSVAQRDLSVQYRGRAEQIEELDKRAAALTSEVEQPISHSTGLSVDEMSAMVAGLVDPMANPHRDLLRHGVQNLSFTSGQIRESGWRGVGMDFTGEIVFSDGGVDFIVPFEGRHEAGAAARADAIGLDALSRLRAGVRPDGTTSEKRALMVVARILGTDRRGMTIASCRDRDLLRIGMASLFPFPAPGEDPAEVPTVSDLAAESDLVDQFCDVEALSQRIVKVLTPVRGSAWLQPGKRAEVEALIRSARIHEGIEDPFHVEVRPQKLIGDGAFRDPERRQWWDFPAKRHPMIEACRRCGGVWFAAMLFREATQEVCLSKSCRFDRSGVIKWPLRFDAFVAHAELYRAAGVELWTEGHDPRTSTSTPDRSSSGSSDFSLMDRRSRWRHKDDVGVAEAKEIVAAYQDPSRTVRAIMGQYRIAPTTMYALIAEAGVELRTTGGRVAPTEGDDESVPE